ncbi:MAG: carboxymuconolactone decarboxylase family protein [Actinophytocola sp.]|uniref:carboxymuconolactone decarboxylase family protein n=1 Tax=Actinophytocola sp. TaxID=1872138 RepID=UPI003D6B8B12
MTDPVDGNDRHTRGLEVLHMLAGGDPAKLESMSALDDVTPDLRRLVVDFAYGEIYSRPGLDPQRRHLVTLSALVALGDTEAELRTHVGLALNIGVLPKEIVETVLHLAVYAGFPRAWAAMRVLQQVFRERGIIDEVDATG